MSKKVMVFLLVAFLFGFCSAGATLADTLEVSILNPSSGITYEEGTTIFLQGIGLFPESNFQLEGKDLSWYSNNQYIGRGGFVSWQPAAGSYRVALIGKKEGQMAVDEISITITAPSFIPSPPIQSGDVASYNFVTNTLYIPFMAGNVPYWVNMAVTSFASPLTFELTDIGVATYSPTASYAYFNLFTNTVFVPDFVDEGASYYMSLKLTSPEAPLTFQLTGFGLNQ